MSTPTKETKKRLHKDVDRNEREKNLSMTEMDEENEKMMNFVKNLLKDKKKKKSTYKPRPVHYEYMTIEDIMNLYPIKESKSVNMYAVIRAFDSTKGILTIMDQTKKSFELFINHMSDPNNAIESRRLPIRPGDIIRLHRLCLFNDFTRRCPHIKNIVIFESFQEKFFSPVYDALNPTLVDSDKEKVKSLSEWNASYLLSREIYDSHYKDYILCDTVFQVLCSVIFEKRVVLVCWNGNPFTNYPCYQSITVEQILDTLSRCRSRHIYTEDFIRHIHNENQLIFISIFGIHRTVAITLKPLDTIIAYNLLIKSDKFYYGRFSYIMYDGILFGRTLRVAAYNSEIAQRLRDQIESYYFLNGKMEICNDFQSPSQILSHSQIFDNSQELVECESNQESLSTHVSKVESEDLKTVVEKIEKKPVKANITTFIEDVDESTLNKLEFPDQIECTHLNFSEHERNILYKHFFNEKNKLYLDSIQLNSFKDIAQHSDANGKTFKIQARFHSFVFSKSKPSLFSSLDQLRKFATIVQCTSSSKYRVCDYKQSFNKFINRTQDYRLDDNGTLIMIQDGTSPKPCSFQKSQFIRLKCPQCSLLSCELYLDFYVILQDYDNSLFLSHFTGKNSNKFFNCNTEELCDEKSDSIIIKIPAIFKYLSHITNDNSHCSRKIYWIFEQYGQTDKEYRIIDACVLSNMVSCGVMTTNS